MLTKSISTGMFCLLMYFQSISFAGVLNATTAIPVPANSSFVGLLSSPEVCEISFESEPFPRIILKDAKFSYSRNDSDAVVWAPSSPTPMDAIIYFEATYGVLPVNLKGKTLDEIQNLVSQQYGRVLDLPSIIYHATFELKSQASNETLKMTCLSPAKKSFEEVLDDLLKNSSLKPSQDL